MSDNENPLDTMAQQMAQQRAETAAHAVQVRREMRLSTFLLAVMGAAESPIVRLVDRALRWVAVFMAFATVGYAILKPDPWRVGAALALALIYSPLWLRRRKE